MSNFYLEDQMQTSNLAHWQQVLKQLQEEDLPREQKRLGEAAATGDWHENAEYEDAERQIELIEVRIEEVKKLIKTLEKKDTGKKAQA